MIYFIIQTICKLLDINAVELKSRSRAQRVVRARFLIYFFALRFTKLTSERIGWLVGRRSHCMVLYGRNKIQSWVDLGLINKYFKDEVFDQALKAIKEKYNELQDEQDKITNGEIENLIDSELEYCLTLKTA